MRTVLMHKKLLGTLGATAVLTLVGGGVTLTSAQAKSQAPRETTLAEAMAQPHGHAAGDPVHAPHTESHKGQDQGAKGVDDGSKKQAAGVATDPDKKPVTAEQLYQPGDYTAGCTPGYGHGKACLPVTPPSAGAMGMSVQQMPWTCTEVRTLLPQGIALDTRGADPAHLDSNGDGTACGAGDA